MLGSNSLVTGLIVAIIFLAIAVAYLSKKCDRLQAKLDKFKDFNEMFAVRETEMIKIFAQQVIDEKFKEANKNTE